MPLVAEGGASLPISRRICRDLESRDLGRVDFRPDANVDRRGRGQSVPGPVLRPTLCLQLLRLSRSPPEAEANFLGTTRDNCPLLGTRAGLWYMRRLP